MAGYRPLAARCSRSLNGPNRAFSWLPAVSPRTLEFSNALSVVQSCSRTVVRSPPSASRFPMFAAGCPLPPASCSSSRCLLSLRSYIPPRFLRETSVFAIPLLQSTVTLGKRRGLKIGRAHSCPTSGPDHKPPFSEEEPWNSRTPVLGRGSAFLFRERADGEG